MQHYQCIFLSLVLASSTQIKSSSDEGPKAYVTSDQQGNLILVDPCAVAMIKAINKHNQQMNLQHLINHIKPHMRSQDVALLSQEDTLEDIHIAAKLGDVPALEKALGQGSSVDLQTTILQYTPLHFASRYGHIDAVRLLLRHNANKAAKSKTGSTPLHLAARNYHDSVVDDLIHDSSLINEVDNNLNTPLHGAALCFDAVIIEKLCAHGARFCANNNQQTPLDVAQQNIHLTQQAGFNRSVLSKNFDVVKSITLLTEKSKTGNSSSGSSSSSID